MTYRFGMSKLWHWQAAKCAVDTVCDRCRKRIYDIAVTLGTTRIAAMCRPGFGAVIAFAPMLIAQSPQPNPQRASAAVSHSSLPALIADAVKYQTDDFHHAGWALRYRVHRTDTREDSVRDLVESADGNVARTLARQGKPLTPEEDAAEQERLRSLTSAEVSRRHRNGENSDKYGMEMISAMPAAMIYTLTPGQPQLQQFPMPQVVLDYTPNPTYHPSTAAQSMLPSLAGRLWIDAETHHLLRIEINITKNLNLAMGLLIRVYQGGTMTYEQHAVAGGHYAYSHIDINVHLRELMVKSVPYHSILDATDVSVLPSPPPLKEAVEMLLSSQTASH